jgi:hypothetical protein
MQQGGFCPFSLCEDLFFFRARAALFSFGREGRLSLLTKLLFLSAGFSFSRLGGCWVFSSGAAPLLLFDLELLFFRVGRRLGSRSL